LIEKVAVKDYIESRKERDDNDGGDAWFSGVFKMHLVTSVGVALKFSPLGSVANGGFSLTPTD